MRTVGIVAEYNPFHNGHKYQIRYAKEVLHADQVVIIMSGNFTQRGIPGICDKSLRVAAAAKSGADTILEIPVDLAISDSPVFAQSAVDILLAFGCNAILFGSECGDITLLSNTAELMAEERYWERFDYETSVSKKTPDQARIDIIKSNMSTVTGDYEYINQPNNLLGIYYLSAIKRRKAEISVFTNPRVDSNYFDDSLPSEHQYASATALRKAISDMFFPIGEGRRLLAEEIDTLSRYMPEEMIKSIKTAGMHGQIVRQNDMIAYIQHAIHEVSDESWSKICVDIPRTHILQKIKTDDSFDAIRSYFLEHCLPLKTDRILCRLALNIMTSSLKQYLREDSYPCWRVLWDHKTPEDRTVNMTSEKRIVCDKADNMYRNMQKKVI